MKKIRESAKFCEHLRKSAMSMDAPGCPWMTMHGCPWNGCPGMPSRTPPWWWNSGRIDDHRDDPASFAMTIKSWGDGLQSVQIDAEDIRLLRLIRAVELPRRLIRQVRIIHAAVCQPYEHRSSSPPRSARPSAPVDPGHYRGTPG